MTPRQGVRSAASRADESSVNVFPLLQRHPPPLRIPAMPSDPRDYKLDLSGPVSDSGHAAAPARPQAKPFLSVHFACCGVYQRIYRDAKGLHYTGHCPRCARPVRFAVGPGGTSARCFTVT